MASKVTEYALMAFFTFISMIVLYFIYLGLINSQKMVNQQIDEGEYSSKCACFQMLSLTDDSIVLRNVACDYVERISVVWPDFEANHNELVQRNKLIRLEHNSSFKENYSLHYPGCE